MNILIPTATRSDEGLSRPVIKRLRERKIIVHELKLIPNSSFLSYRKTQSAIRKYNSTFAIITGDRVEMTAAASSCFRNRLPFAHLYAGTLSNIATFDDINRHVITMMSSVQFCESDLAKERVVDMFRAIDRQPNAHVVGITHLDDVVADDELVPGEKYNLILYNPLTYGCGSGIDTVSKINSELREIEKQLNSYLVIAISPNDDDFRTHIKSFYDNVQIHKRLIYYDTIPRAQFLGLLRHCERFITNSSTAIYEAPQFLEPEQIIHVGDRNRNRDKGPFETGASDKIVELLCTMNLGNKIGKSQT